MSNRITLHWAKYQPYNTHKILNATTGGNLRSFFTAGKFLHCENGPLGDRRHKAYHALTYYQGPLRCRAGPAP